MEAEKNRLDILIVEPDEAEQSALTGALTAAGTVIHAVPSGSEARAILKKTNVHCVVAETEMTGMNGIELLKLVRRQPYHFDIPVLLLLQDKDEHMIAYARDERVDRVLVKPLGPDALRQALGEIRQRRQNRSEVEKKLIQLRGLQLSGEYDRAKSLAREILAENTAPEALYTLCKIYYREKEYAKSKSYLKKLLELKPSSKTLHLLSKVCRAEEQGGEALVHLLTASRQNPVNMDLKIDLGKLYLAMGMKEEADRIFQEVLASRKSDLIFIKIGKAYLKSGDLQQAATYLDQTVQPIPETAFIFQMYADALAKAGEYDKSIKQYNRCLKLSPNDPTCLYHLALTQQKIGNQEQAEKILRYLLILYPNHIHAREALARLSTPPVQQ